MVHWWVLGHISHHLECSPGGPNAIDHRKSFNWSLPWITRAKDNKHIPVVPWQVQYFNVQHSCRISFVPFCANFHWLPSPFNSIKTRACVFGHIPSQCTRKNQQAKKVSLFFKLRNRTSCLILPAYSALF
jgi:hypothetical protein